MTGIIVQLVVKSQILAGGRGLGTFKSGLKGGVHIVKTDQVEDIAGKYAFSLLHSKFRWSSIQETINTYHSHVLVYSI